MPPINLDDLAPLFVLLGVLATAFLTWVGTRRGAKTAEKVSTDDLTTELVTAYRLLNADTKQVFEERLQEERKDRAYRENELRDRISDLERIVEQFGEYVAWCTAGHAPPPFAVSKKILAAAKRYRNKET